MTRICLAWGMTLVAASVWAAGKVGDQAPETDVAIALRAESQSTSQAFDRWTALRSSRESDQQPEAWWQSGFIQVGEKWLPYDEAAGIRPKLRQQYEVKRAAALPTAAEQLRLADWCREQGLADQERTHLIRALSTGQAKEPAKILQRLGYRQVGPWWFTEADLKSYSAEMQSMLKEWKRLQPKLEKLAARLEGNAKQREKALEELRTVTTLPAIPVLERTLALNSERTAAAVVQVLSDMDSYRSSQALARMAIASDWKSIRDAATEELERRPLEEFVPMTLELMSLPIETNLLIGEAQRNILRNPAGGREWRFVFTREGRSTVELAALRIIDCRYIPMTRRELIQGFSLSQQRLSEDTAREALDALQERLRSVDDLNEWTQRINERVGGLLAAVTSQSVSNAPEDWWSWWDASTDSQLSGPKQVVVVDESLQKIEAPIRKSCLAAGTPVWTADGFVPIEKIQVGDRVLSKDVESGELAYKPVLQTTRREKAALAKVSVGDDRFEASPGHNFWISGRGWTRTNQLKTGMPAHTVTGSAALAVEDTGRKADVFNLVVADFHTYFVGKSMILGHDVIQPSPTDALVPGLTPALAE